MPQQNANDHKKGPYIYGSIGDINKSYKAAKHLYAKISALFNACPKTYVDIENSLKNIHSQIDNLTTEELREYLDELNKSTKSIKDLLKSYETLLLWLKKPSELTSDSIKQLFENMKSYVTAIQKHPITKLIFDASSLWAGASKILKLLEQAQTKSEENKETLQPNIYLTMAGYAACIMLPVLIHFVTKPETGLSQKSILDYLKDAEKNSKATGIITKDPILSMIISALQQYIGQDMPSIFMYWDFITKQISTISSVAGIIPKIVALGRNPYTQAFPKIAFDFLASTTMPVAQSRAEIKLFEGSEPLREATEVKLPELTKLIYGNISTRQAFNYSDEYKQDILSNLGLILLEAVKQQDNELVKILLATPYNADINTQDKDNKTPLMIAIEKQDEELIALLLTCKDIDLGQATLTAIDSNNPKILGIILDCPYFDQETLYELPSGTYINIMEYAVLRNNEDAIKMFIELELLPANQPIPDTESPTPPVITANPNDDPINDQKLETLLVQHTDSDHVLATESIETQTDRETDNGYSLPTIKTKNITQKSTNNKQSMLIRHINILKDQTKLNGIKGLLKLPDYQDLRKTDIQGNTALHIAITNKNIPSALKIQLIELLLENGADIHQTNKAGLSVYDIAKATKNKLLLELLTDHEKKSTSSATKPKR